MGDPKKLKKKYQTRRHPWIESEIIESRELRKEFGLANTREILKAESFLKKYKNIAKILIVQTTKQGEKEKIQVLDKMQRLGLLPAGGTLDSILGLGTKDILNRRLQSVVYNKKLSRTMNQARQFIVHRHVSIAGKQITSPGYITSLLEEAHLQFKVNSKLADEEHPERAIAVAAERPEETAVKVALEKEREEHSVKAEAKAEKSAETKKEKVAKTKEEISEIKEEVAEVKE